MSNEKAEVTLKTIADIQVRFLKEVSKEKDTEKKKRICKKYIEEELSSVFSLIKNLGGEKRVEIGKGANELRQLIVTKAKEAEEGDAHQEQWIDISFPGEDPRQGSIHPLTQLQEQCVDIFEKMGFTTVEGPELVTEWYNFDALNFQKDHPVREMQDTFFVKNRAIGESGEKEKWLMRTHTSAAQVLYMKDKTPPFRIVVPGRVFRNEALDNSHEINFYQMECLMVGEDVSVAHFKAISQYFFSQILEADIEVRLRPSYFPFTEPSFEVDISCTICKKKGCSTCKNTGWIEVMGAGVVHPNVLKSAGIDSEKYTGFAFGGGLDRIAMMKSQIDDVRLFYGGDLRFLKQF